MCENNCLFTDLEEEQEKDSRDKPVWAVQGTGSNAPAYESLAQLDQFSLYSFFHYNFTFYTRKIFLANYFGKKNPQTTQFLNSNLLNFNKLTFSCKKKTYVENFRDTYMPVCELLRLTLSNLFFLDSPIKWWVKQCKESVIHRHCLLSFEQGWISTIGR